MSYIERRILNGTIAHYRSATGKLHDGQALTAAEHFARLMDYSDCIAEQIAWQIAWRKFRGVNT